MSSPSNIHFSLTFLKFFDVELVSYFLTITSVSVNKHCSEEPCAYWTRTKKVGRPAGNK